LIRGGLLTERECLVQFDVDSGNGIEDQLTVDLCLDDYHTESHVDGTWLCVVEVE